MRKQLTNGLVRKVFTSLLALVIVVCSSANLYANHKVIEVIEKSAEVTYKGVKDKLLVFKVDYKNEKAENFNLVIKNENNEILFTRNYDAKPLATDIYLSDVPDRCKLTFSIRSTTKQFSQAFEINSKVKVVEEYMVKGI